MNAVGVKYMPTVTKHDIVDFVYDHLNKFGWKTTFNYLVYRPRQFYTKPLAVPEGSSLEFKKYVDYCYLLSNNFTGKDEAARYKEKDGISIYFSVVLYWLLVSFGVVNEKKLKLCQGYFTYKLEENQTSTPRYRAGVHAWLCYDGSTIDVTIWRQKDGFNFEKYGFSPPVLMGQIPEGLELYGFDENRSLAKEYARKFARESGKTFYKWINFHKEQAELLHKTRQLVSSSKEN